MVDVGIVEKRGEIVFLTSHAEALEVDDIRFALMEHEVLRLEVAVNHVWGRGAEAFSQAEEDRVFTELGSIFAKVSFDEMFEEIFLFPAVEWLVKDGLEFEIFGGTSVEKLVELFEGGTVVRLAFFERGIFEGEEVLVS